MAPLGTLSGYPRKDSLTTYIGVDHSFPLWAPGTTRMQKGKVERRVRYAHLPRANGWEDTEARAGILFFDRHTTLLLISRKNPDIHVQGKVVRSRAPSSCKSTQTVTCNEHKIDIFSSGYIRLVTQEWIRQVSETN